MIIYDASFIVSHIQSRNESGIYRVEKAWLEHLVKLDQDTDLSLMLMIRLKKKVLIIDGSVGSDLLRMLNRSYVLGKRLLPRLLWRLGRKRRTVKVELAQRAVARFRVNDTPDRIARVLKDIVPRGGWYVAVMFGIPQENIMEGICRAGLHTATMLHDTIPLDFPELCDVGCDEILWLNIDHNAKRGDLVLCNSQATADDFIRHATLRHKTTSHATPVVAHLGLHPLVSSCETVSGGLPAPLSADRPLFMILGTIEPRKNHLFLLDLWEDMAGRTNPEDMPQLVVAGRWGWKIDAIRERFETSPEHGKSVFIFEGPDDLTVLRLLHGCNALLMPSVAEGFGLPVLEAAREGIPVIANDLPVYREIAGTYPDLIALDAKSQWIERLQYYAATRIRHEKLSPPTWDAHFSTILKALADFDR